MLPAVIKHPEETPKIAEHEENLMKYFQLGTSIRSIIGLLLSMPNNDTTSRMMTVADLRAIIADLPATTQLWAYDTAQGTFTPVEFLTHDKRANGLNFWINTEENPNGL